ncbi:hypothetical protein [Kordiimonas marina]|uniref:hypothetical protein n=1 Tax=Kordiimonas marina TaxID=2872312 RepID=UPI001FF51443|nr:hypothetical protein [Kordiimonas marina]MCJ9429219.1 hypothetical protein [Kordiimonas marina]
MADEQPTEGWQRREARRKRQTAKRAAEAEKADQTPHGLGEWTPVSKLNVRDRMFAESTGSSGCFGLLAFLSISAAALLTATLWI